MQNTIKILFPRQRQWTTYGNPNGQLQEIHSTWYILLEEMLVARFPSSKLLNKCCRTPLQATLASLLGSFMASPPASSREPGSPALLGYLLHVHASSMASSITSLAWHRFHGLASPIGCVDSSNREYIPLCHFLCRLLKLMLSSLFKETMVSRAWITLVKISHEHLIPPHQTWQASAIMETHESISCFLCAIL